LDLFVKYQRHHGKTTKLQVEAPLIYTSGEVKACHFIHNTKHSAVATSR